MKVTLDLEINGEERTCTFEGTYTAATPDVHYLRNGDPGYPGDPSEFEWHKCEGLTDKEAEALTDKQLEAIQDKADEEAAEDDGPDGDAVRDDREDR